jgi:hypothetical protein
MYRCKQHNQSDCFNVHSFIVCFTNSVIFSFRRKSECTGVRFLNFQKNTFDSDCDEFRLETQSRKFLRRSNLNEIIDMCHGLDRINCLLCVYICHLNIDSISFLLFGHLFFFLPQIQLLFFNYSFPENHSHKNILA